MAVSATHLEFSAADNITLDEMLWDDVANADPRTVMLAEPVARILNLLSTVPEEKPCLLVLAVKTVGVWKECR
jgi:hypothetical protein